MEFSYCSNCRKMTGHKRALGWGTFFGGVATLGASTLAIPFYPKRCIICGNESCGEEFKPQYSSSEERDMKKCPACAEVIKLEAIKCRFCGEKFDPADVARQVAEVKSTVSFDDRVLCSDGTCTGVIGADGRCGVCGKPYKPDSY